MSTSVPCRRVLAAVVLALGVVTSLQASPAPARAAGHPTLPMLARSAAMRQDAITGTTGQSQWQVITSTSGLTVVWLPRQVASGGRLSVQMRTVPRARVTVTLGFPDGTSVVAYRRATLTGDARFLLPIAYQPQGSAEAATVTVVAALPLAGVADSVQGSVAVLQHINLQGSLKLPRFVVAGRALTVTVASNQPGAFVRFLLAYPDRQVERPYGGYTNAAGILTRRFAISRSDGTRGYLYVQAWLSYDGVQLRIVSRVPLRA